MCLCVCVICSEYVGCIDVPLAHSRDATYLLPTTRTTRRICRVELSPRKGMKQKRRGKRNEASEYALRDARSSFTSFAYLPTIEGDLEDIHTLLQANERNPQISILPEIDRPIQPGIRLAGILDQKRRYHSSRTRSSILASPCLFPCCASL